MSRKPYRFRNSNGKIQVFHSNKARHKAVRSLPIERSYLVSKSTPEGVSRVGTKPRTRKKLWKRKNEKWHREHKWINRRNSNAKE